VNARSERGIRHLRRVPRRRRTLCASDGTRAARAGQACAVAARKRAGSGPARRARVEARRV